MFFLDIPILLFFRWKCIKTNLSQLEINYDVRAECWKIFVDGDHYAVMFISPAFSENHDLVNADLTTKCESYNSIVKDDEVKEIWQRAKDVLLSSVWRALPVGISIDSWCEFKLLILCLKWQLVLYNITTQDHQNSQLPFLRKLSMILIN